MGKNTSISLGNYYDNFIENRLKEGRFKNASEIIRAGLRLLEEEENRNAMLRAEIEKGIESGIDEDFDPQEFKKMIRKEHGINGEV
ncbi:type II toxin-antitoxin system ParD family antitoxin [Cyclobacterium jeungdonense]|uniref:Type II toxin-antitoxin system ParD family antitoxin n=1 Tax=Cyclobacterium jeungdonense TaxID=708087 RepID=A0ABT8CEH5_9BACT|nr:type II toxin-antitoxin system ParD family antitoxin [Cyclobacterium jeungdonense]MDN3690183.1 type II toxin-antitoxin system ParD family antitoxin [Cyclobacterium jeungdonense]